MSCDRFFLSLLLCSYFWNCYAQLTQAQIIPDNSLDSENSIVTPQESLDLIEGGAVRDNNLFHSFSEFNIPDGGNVYFSNPENVINILTRITGNNASNILGTLGVNGNANLFLLNPNGIVFGENARLDINGSFLATTAESYLFENDLNYSATNPEAPPLLTVNMPIGLQMGNNPAAINIQGSGHNLAFDFNTFELDRSNGQTGLTVSGNNSLAFLGGDINFTGGSLNAESGNIAIGSVENSNVSLEEDFSFGYAGVSQFRDLSLNNASSINSQGNISLRGKNISLEENSIIINNSSNGEIKLNAEASIVISGIQDSIFPTGILSQVEASAMGNGADISIATTSLEIDNNNAGIFSTVAGNGSGGNINIAASAIDLQNNLEDTSLFTGIFSRVLAGENNGGNINLSAENIFVSNLAFIKSETFASGKGGNLIIDANDLRLQTGGQIATENSASGNGGNIEISGKDVEIVGDFSTVASVVLNPETTGDSGDITFNTETVAVRNNGQLQTITFGMGNSGDVEINTQKLIVKDGISQIAAATFAEGNGGNLTVRASESVEVRGTGGSFDENIGMNDVFSSGLFASAEFGSTGQGGDLVIETGDLLLAEGVKVSSGTIGAGDAGDVFIFADSLEIRDTVVDLLGIRSGINNGVEFEGTGNGGDINIVVNDLNLIDGGSIITNAGGNGNAGNIDIQADKINISGVSRNAPVNEVPQESLPSTISAFSDGDFNAGSISIDSNSLTISDRAVISVSGFSRGNSGNINLNTSQLNLDGSAIIEAEVNTGNRGNINLITDNLFVETNSKISATATGRATGGNIIIDNNDNFLLLGNSRIIADAIEGDGGNIQLDTIGFFVSSDSLISASSEFGLDGNIEIETPENDPLNSLEELPVNLLDATDRLVAGCSAREFANFAVIGRGGLSENPSQDLTESIWLSGFETSPDSGKNQINTVTTRQGSTDNSIVEAQSWKINSQGKVELTTNSSQSNLPYNQINCSS